MLPHSLYTYLTSLSSGIYNACILPPRLYTPACALLRRNRSFFPYPARPDDLNFISGMDGKVTMYKFSFMTSFRLVNSYRRFGWSCFLFRVIQEGFRIMWLVVTKRADQKAWQFMNYPENGCRNILRNIRNYLQIYTESYHKRLEPSPALLWEYEMLLSWHRLWAHKVGARCSLLGDKAAAVWGSPHTCLMPTLTCLIIGSKQNSNGAYRYICRVPYFSIIKYTTEKGIRFVMLCLCYWINLPLFPINQNAELFI
jgi:hypothetical protein